jgi:phospholipid/cholesterol/gamma-HCH transport system permease protein
VSTPAGTSWWGVVKGGDGSRLDEVLTATPLYRPLETAAELAGLTIKLTRAFVTPPFNWLREAAVETSKGFRTVCIPMLVASLVYVLAFGPVLFGGVVDSLGAGDRLAGGWFTGVLRELSTWLTYMVLAAILGSSLAGDLGARTSREELDALDVLGVDKIRSLILPRVVAISVVGLAMSLIVVLVDVTCMIWLDAYTVHQPIRSSLSAAVLQMNPYDLIALIVKHTILGAFIGIVACQKGLSARGGAEGVGRAVSQTVLITFFGVWLINSLFNTGYLTVFPEAIGLRG